MLIKNALSWCFGQHYTQSQASQIALRLPMYPRRISNWLVDRQNISGRSLQSLWSKPDWSMRMWRSWLRLVVWLCLPRQLPAGKQTSQKGCAARLLRSAVWAAILLGQLRASSLLQSTFHKPAVSALASLHVGAVSTCWSVISNNHCSPSRQAGIQSWCISTESCWHLWRWFTCAMLNLI